jgi:hypothetical protein
VRDTRALPRAIGTGADEGTFAGRRLMGICEDMPLLARHEGVLDGTYPYFSAANATIDEHQSRLLCRFHDDGHAVEAEMQAG